MKIKEGFVLRHVMGKAVVIAAGSAADSFHGMIKLNATAADIWQWLTEGCDADQIIENVTKKYEVSAEKAADDVKVFTDSLLEKGVLEL